MMEDRALRICPSAQPVFHLVSIHPRRLSHPLFPFSLLPTMLMKYELFERFYKNGNLNQRCSIDAFLTFGVFKALWTEAASLLQQTLVLGEPLQ